MKNKNKTEARKESDIKRKKCVHKDSEHRIATAQSTSTPLPGVDEEGARPLKTPRIDLKNFGKNIDIITVGRYSIRKRQVNIMMIQNLMQKKNMTKYRLSKSSGIPYTTLTDICSGKAQLEKCSAETIYKLSKELGVSMETLLAPCFEKRCSFDLFKSNVCHRLKELGDVEFIIDTLEKDDIRRYYDRQWYPESLYLLAMLDYISRENEIPLCAEYSDLRSQKLTEPVYPSSILAMAAVSHASAKEEAYRRAIPEFLRFNIIENEVRNVI